MFKSMKSKITLLIAFFHITTHAFAAYTDYDARIGEKEVLTPTPALTPRLNGPQVYGIRPDKIFIYRIPCQGERPIRFEADGLPTGLDLNPETGIITGRVSKTVGEYQVTFKAVNRHGKAERLFKIKVGDKIALTPPTGWNSWGGHMVDVSDKIMRTATDVFVNRGLADVGFQYIGVDDCWMRLSQKMYDKREPKVIARQATYDYKSTGTIGPVRDEYGNILPNGKFPDMKAMTDYIHSFGLKAGMYSGPGRVTCQRWAGSEGHEKADADQYAAWGFDLFKYDLGPGKYQEDIYMKRIPGYTTMDYWRPMSQYIHAQDRDIVFNLCQYGMYEPWKWAPSIGIQTWRMGSDLNHDIHSYFDTALQIAGPLREYSKPGQWNDPDFMYLHRIRNHMKMGEPSVEIPLDTNQRYQYATLWSIICAPYFFSCDIDNIDTFTIRLLANADLLNINQDELGHVAEVVRNQNNQTVMIKRLTDGTQVLAVFNRDAKQEAVIDVSWDSIGVREPAQVYDAWRQKDMGACKGGISVRLSPNGVGLFKIICGK
jgi:alpha-galactosidase